MTTDDALSRRGAGAVRAPPLMLVLVLALTAACSTARGGQDGGSSPFSDHPVRVEVENRNWSTMHVYVLAGGQFASLGQISSQNTREYEVPASVMGNRKEIRLAADPIGSREAFISDRILVEPGDVVSWTLNQPLIHSHVFVN